MAPGKLGVINSSDRIRLRHMLDAAGEAVSFVANRTMDDLSCDRMFLLAAVKEIEIIGEAASRISEETKSRIPAVPWPKVIGIRNRLIHAYARYRHGNPLGHTDRGLPNLISALEQALERDFSDS